MKKTINRVLAMLSLLAILFTLAGCQNPNEGMDEARRTHAYYTDDSFEKIRFDGKTYVRYQKEVSFEVYEHDILYLTEKDVPAYIASAIGEMQSYNKDKTAIYVEDETHKVRAMYLLESFASEFEALVQSGLCEYYRDADWTEQQQALQSEQQKAAIATVLAGEPLNMSEYQPEMEAMTDYYRCDKGLGFEEYAFTLCKDYAGNYYLDAHYGVYKVPSELAQHFKLVHYYEEFYDEDMEIF